MALRLMYITNRPDIALIAQKYGVDRIWIDLEVIGKGERQKGVDSVKSHHRIADIANIKPQLTSSEILVRVNHWYEGSADEINAVIAAGADLVMLPYWKTLDEVRKFVSVVGGRCKTILLLETREAVEIVDDVLKMGGFDEIHIGLNDLHLSYGKDFMFELLTDGTVEMLCRKFALTDIPYGFGGIARMGEGIIPAEKIILEHYRLGSSRAILSRSFCDSAKIESSEEIDQVFAVNMKALRDYEEFAGMAAADVFKKNQDELAVSIKQVAEGIRRLKNGGG